MSDEREKPALPFGLNSGRIILLLLGAVLAVYVASTLLGGLGNYQQLREAADEARQAQQAPATP
jgi:hypothetical protein